MSAKKRGLGKGLDALLSTSNVARVKQVQEDLATVEPRNDNEGELQQLAIELLQPGKYQPRKDMSAEALEELASSIQAQGVIQPVLVRRLGVDNYEIVAGERRWRAAQQAGLTEIPCLIKAVDDQSTMAIALIENIQREDLNAMEEAIALQRLISEFEMTHQQVAEAVGKSRATVSNLLRLNGLNDDVKKLLEYGDIEMGHARALLSLTGDIQSTTARLVAGKGLTVRETEALVQKTLQGETTKAPKTVDPDIQRLQSRLVEHLGAKVDIKHNSKGRGKMVISYTSLDQLDGILNHLQLPE